MARINRLARRAGLAASVLTALSALTGCATGDGTSDTGSYSSYSGSGSGTSSSNESGSTDLYAVDHNGKTYILNEKTSGEATIVGNQGVTVVTSDNDGTATVVDPSGDVSIYVSNGMGGSFKVDTAQ